MYREDDSLPTRDAGTWTEKKIFFWNRYIEITTMSMCDSPKWPAGVIYVDLFAGPGVCRIKKNNKRFPGSALVAAHAPKRFRKLIACELEHDLAEALQQRLNATPSRDRFKVVRGDCNAMIDRVITEIPPKSLVLAFIDPENLDVPFETVEALANRGATDLLILFADSMDIVRNVDTYEKQKVSKLDRMLGPGSNWRSEWAKLGNRSRPNICRRFSDLYCDQLRRRLGYQGFGEKTMESERGPLYRIIFASKHERGLDFWRKITRKDIGGQPDLPFE